MRRRETTAKLERIGQLVGTVPPGFLGVTVRKPRSSLKMRRRGPNNGDGGDMDFPSHVCPRCGDDVPRLLATLNPEVILECSECGEVWREGPDGGSRA